MGIKKRFIEMIKSGYPEFDPKTDSVEIEFDGGGDSFGSFSYISIWPNREGELQLSNYEDLLFDVIDASGVEYGWNGAGTTGRIEYNVNSEEEISVSTFVSNEYWGEVYEDDEEDDTTVPDEIKDALMKAPEIDFNSIDPSVITYYNDHKSEGETSKDETNG